jgi:hypothetical protein
MVLLIMVALYVIVTLSDIVERGKSRIHDASERAVSTGASPD